MTTKKLECVTVCVNYGDFLAWTLPFNKFHFDNMVVVTSTADVETQKLCEYWHVQCIHTDVCFEGDGFNKGKMINAGLERLGGNAWVVHMDADIFLPPHFRDIVQAISLDESCIFGLDRMMCRDFAAWLQYFMAPKVQHENDIYVHPGPFDMGVRLSGRSHGGWFPLGYFQMWHQGHTKRAYPTQHTSAARGDMQFATSFPREKRQLLPECIAIHLETSSEGMGANWNGRKTPRFGADFVGSPITEATIESPMLLKSYGVL